jgi:SAM-dependent methyltransferase
MKTGYRNDQYELVFPDGIEFDWWHLARNRIVANAIKTFAKPEPVVLDVGCGRGIAVKYLRDEGIDCVGVELAKPLAIKGADQHIRVGMNALDIPRAERKRYDTILLLDVIEHISDPVEFLQNIADAFPNLSHIIFTVPACQELWSDYDKFCGHYRRYTAEMVRTLSHQIHCKLAWQSYFFHLMYVPAWVFLKLKMKRSVKNTAPHGVSKWVHRLIYFFMSLDYQLLPRSAVGTSILVCFTLSMDKSILPINRNRD